MRKKIIFCFLMLVIFCTSVLGVNYQAEDNVIVEATVLGLGRDSAKNALIHLNIDRVISYAHNESSMHEPLKKGQAVTLGFLWGHRKVTSPNAVIEKGNKIIARIGYHYNFTTHTGHVYSLEKICKPSEVKIDEECFPSECKGSEHIVNRKCVELECDDSEIAMNHVCVALVCDPGQTPQNHECVNLKCGYDEYVEGNSCVKLICGDDEEISENTCAKLKCNIFSKPKDHKCSIKWNFVLGIVLFFIFAIFLWYERLVKSIKKTKFYKNFNETHVTLFIAVLTIIVLLTPLIIRLLSGTPLLMGEEPYYHARIAQDLIENNFKFNIINESVNPYHIVLAAIAKIIGVYFASIVIPLILGILSVVFLTKLSKKLELDQLTRIMVLMLVVVSPGFIYLFTFSTPHAFAVFIALVGIILILKNKTIHLLLGSLMLLISSLNSMFNMQVCTGIFLFVIIKKKRSKKMLFSLALIIFLVALLYNLHNFALRDTIPQFNQNILKDSITSFGALIGFSMFNLFLAFFGFISIWKQKRKYSLFYTIFAILVLFALLVNKNYNMYWNFAIGFFSGIGFISLLKTRWDLDLVKELTILLVICGLLFSTALYTKQLVETQPTKDLLNGLEWLKNQDNGIVLSHYSRGYWIDYVSNKQAFLNSGYDSNTNDLLNISDEVFYSRDLVKTTSLLLENNITYIFIDNEMEKGLVWTKEEQGLLFLFRNKEKFKKVYSNPGVEIWVYKKEE